MMTRRRMMLLMGSGGAEIKTVSGTAPLSLPDAVAAAIMSLIQTGKVSQSGTPTPQAPVDIVCNNGTLRMVDDELPSGYRRVLDINFDGTAYYKTEEKLYGPDVVTMTLSNTSSSGQNVFGAYSGTAAGNKNFSFYVYGGNSGSNSYLRYNESLYRPRFGSGERTVSFGAGGTTGFVTDVDFDEETFESSATAYIGHLPNSSSSKYSGTINGAITVGSRLKYVPCERISDNVVGYYEVKTGVFLEPVAGSPTFSGYDMSHLTLKVVGTSEVLTVGEQTAAAVDLLAVGDYADTHDLISGAVTRRCGVLVLDGSESWMWRTNRLQYNEQLDADPFAPSNTVLCTHYNAGSTSASGNISYSAGILYIRDDVNGGSASAFKAFCAAQYAAGTPVIILYPRKTAAEETVPAQPLATIEGDNEITVTANVTDVPIKVTYKAVKTSS